MPSLRAISLNPNISPVDISQAKRSIYSLLRGNDTDAIDRFKERFLDKFADESYQATTFITGRGGWYALLKALGIGEGDEVMVPAFTCVAVVNPVRWVGATPVFVDNSSDFHLDPNDAQGKLSERTKILLVQHTFGQPDDIVFWKSFCDEHSIILIEDCAHALGAEVGGSQTGLHGKASFYSFGRDKCLTAGTGGMVITQDEDLDRRLQEVHSTLEIPTISMITRQLLYIVTTEWIYKLYAIHPVIGKIFHSLVVALGLNQRANSLEEKRGKRDDKVLRQWDGNLAELGVLQIEKYDDFLEHRRNAAQQYNQQLSKLGEAGFIKMPTFTKRGGWLRYSILVQEPDKLRAFAMERNIVFGEWYDQVIGPIQVDLDAISYTQGTAPYAEKLSAHVVNLPTAPRFGNNDLQAIIDTVQEYFDLNPNEKLEPF